MNEGNRSFFDAMSEAMGNLTLWPKALVALIILIIPFGIAYLDGVLQAIIDAGEWRILLLQPVIVLYILATVPLFRRSQERIAKAIRPIVQLDDAEYDRLVQSVCETNPRSEWIAFGAGMAGGLVLNLPSHVPNRPLQIYLLLAYLIMYGMMGWAGYKAYAATRLSAVLTRQPLTIDIFDISPFIPVGRQGLLLSMLFVGGTTISLLFVFTWEDILSWQNLVVYGIAIIFTVAIFFLNMWPTHKLLSETKNEQLDNVERHIAQAYSQLVELTTQNEDLAVTMRINAWVAMEERLKLTKTWPYNTAMLRTLFVTTLTPIAVGVGKIVGVLILNGLRM